MTTEHKLPGFTWESFAEKRIREAQQQRAFDHLSGFGRPIPGIDEPLDENWWIKEKLKREDINAVPPTLQARLERFSCPCSVSAVPEVVGTFLGCELVKRASDCLPESVDGSLGGLSKACF